MSLNTRILSVAALLMAAASIASYLAYRALADELIERWGRQVAEIQVRYDSARLLQSLEREIGLAKQMATSSVLIAWALDPDDSLLEDAAIAELERFRTNLRDQSYFVALRRSLRYYYNNAENEYAGRQFRYVLDPDKPDDAWFFQLIEEGRDFHLNVNPDTELGVTKLWIDVLVRDAGGEILGMVGTGLELNAFLQDIVDIGQEGINTLFVDYNGAIQLYRDRNYIDFASIVKPEGQKNTVDLLFDNPDDGRRIMAMLERLRDDAGRPGQVQVESDFVTIDGTTHLAGAAFLPNIGWFEITLVDLNALLPRRHLVPLIVVFIAALLITLLVFHLVIRFRILDPIIRLESATLGLKRGEFTLPELPKPSNEIGRLARQFEEMAATLGDTTRNLEQQVAERTEELNRLARTDPLTALPNRRAMDEILSVEVQRAARQGSAFGLVWLDLDDFKNINDEGGHQRGDEVLRQAASWIREAIRPYDHAGRFGGDEFLVVLSPCGRDELEEVAERIRRHILARGEESEAPVTASVGAVLAQPGESIDLVLKKADQALYRAKQLGRNRVNVA